MRLIQKISLAFTIVGAVVSIVRAVRTLRGEPRYPARAVPAPRDRASW